MLLKSSVICTLLPACGSEAPAADSVSTASPATSTAGPGSPSDSTSILAAQQVMRAFLDASREPQPDRAALDTLDDCGDAGTHFPSTLLAAYDLLPFEVRGDTVVGRASVITVAEQDIDRRAENQFVARERVRRDVLEWDVIPLDDGRWVVCNGLQFGYRGADSLTTWRPEGASYASALRLADSIARARP